MFEEKHTTTNSCFSTQHPRPWVLNTQATTVHTSRVPVLGKRSHQKEEAASAGGGPNVTSQCQLPSTQLPTPPATANRTAGGAEGHVPACLCEKRTTFYKDLDLGWASSWVKLGSVTRTALQINPFSQAVPQWSLLLSHRGRSSST